MISIKREKRLGLIQEIKKLKMVPSPFYKDARNPAPAMRNVRRN